MKWIVKGFIVAIIAAFALSAAACGPTVYARKIEDIRGTYTLKEYYVSENGQNVSFAGKFEYFYLVVTEGASIRIVYKNSGEKGYRADEYGYVCKYQTGSDEYIEELKFRFIMPDSPVEGGLVVNYLTVTAEDILACQKIVYEAASENGKPSVWKQIYISLERISGDTDLEFVEEMLGYKISLYEEAEE
ncbi:MAG: hypothetical protein J6Z34_04175 [Clostridia bacterium]|nr:hypothetical protein [Clostridia bacterium]